MTFPNLERPADADRIAADNDVKAGPRQCCADYAIVTSCDGDTDQLYCGICGRRWSQPCSVGDLVPAVEV